MKAKIVKVMVASALVVAFASPASAGTNVTRHVTVTYEFPAVGQGDLGGDCVDQPTPPPIPPQLGSCMAVVPNFGEDHVTVDIRDSSGNPVYITIRQAGNPEREVGCGTIVDFPIIDQSPGGNSAEPVVVYPWPGPGLNHFPGTQDPNELCQPGSINLGGGDGMFTFYDDLPPSGGQTFTARYSFPAIGQGDVGGVCVDQPTTPPVPPQLGSCVSFTPPSDYAYVDITAIGDDGNPVYITMQQDNNPNFASGCGIIRDFPINGQGPGGSAADPIAVFPWAGPGLNDFLGTLDPAELCRGSTSLTGGEITFYFHN